MKTAIQGLKVEDRKAIRKELRRIREDVVDAGRAADEEELNSVIEHLRGDVEALNDAIQKAFGRGTE